MKGFFKWAVLVMVLSFVAACGGGGAAPAPAPGSYTVSGVVSGLTGTGLVLQNNAGDDLHVSSSGTFTFATSVASGATYSVTVKTQPSNPNQICTPNNNTGLIDGANVTSVSIVCSTDSYTLGGIMSGLTGTVVLQNIYTGYSTTITANGPFTLVHAVADGSDYGVTVKTQPAGQICTPSSNMGTVAGANVTNVTVSCTSNLYTLGGTVSGLTGTLVLKSSGLTDLSVTANGPFNFATSLIDGAIYNVLIQTQPSGQTCSVNDAGHGTIAGANVSNVVVTCSSNSYTLGGTISGLPSKWLTLQNGTDQKGVIGSGAFTFGTALADGASYSVSVKIQPPGMNCLVTNGTGTISGANVTNVLVSCADIPSYTIGGTVSGLTGTLALQDNGGDDKTIAANGSYTFATAVIDGGGYNVTVKTQPAGQLCSMITGTGIVDGANVTTANVSCVTNAPNSYTIAGTVSGLAGSGLVLKNNGGDSKVISADGPFVFATPVTDGGAYSVTVTPPSCPAQSCLVTGGSGTVSGGNVTGITVTCAQDKIRFFSSNWGDTTLRVTDDIASLANNATASPRIISNATLTTLTANNNLAVDRNRDLVYVISNGTQILVFNNASSASGDTAPARIITVTGGNVYGLAVDSTNDRLYVGQGVKILVFNSASAINGTVIADAKLTTVSTGGIRAIYVDETNDRLYASGFFDYSMYVYDSASTASTGTQTSRTVKFDVNNIPVYGLTVDACTDRLYVATRGVSAAGYNIFAFSGASTMTGSYDPDTDSAARFALGYAMTIARDQYDRLYILSDSDTQLKIFSNARLLSGTVTPSPKIVNGGAVKKSYGFGVTSY